MPPAKPVNNPSPGGLSKTEAESRLKSVGPNTMPDEAVNPLRSALGKLGAPVPWMLEAAIAIEIVLGLCLEGAIIDLIKIPVFARLGIT